MSKPTTPRTHLTGLGALVLALALASPVHAESSTPAGAAKPTNTLQSLAELDGKAPSHRTLNIQTWNTSEGARVLFVEAHELPDRKSVV